jgi:hypothetical protein
MPRAEVTSETSNTFTLGADGRGPVTIPRAHDAGRLGAGANGTHTVTGTVRDATGARPVR